MFHTLIFLINFNLRAVNLANGNNIGEALDRGFKTV